MEIGFIGLGHMGTGMAVNLLKTGENVTVYNRTASKAAPLLAQGAKLAKDIPEACRTDIVITMLANDVAVEGLTFEAGGILDSLPAGAIHISSSTISVRLSEKLDQAHRDKGQHFVAAPVFGRPDLAEAGQLFVVVAGAPTAIATSTPVFEAIGQNSFIVSEQPEDANLVKISGNFLIASVIEALGEAMALIGKAGIDRQSYLSILTSTLFSAPVYKTYGALIAQGKFEPAGFAAALGFKDIRLALAAGEGLEVPLPLASLLHDRFLSLLAQGGGNLDWSAIASLASKDAGMPDR